jgi:hypothetical protein
MLHSNGLPTRVPNHNAFPKLEINSREQLTLLMRGSDWKVKCRPA